MLGSRYEGQDCALAASLEVIGERWTLLIVRDAFYGVRRFNDFQAHLDIPRAVLSDRLSGLVSEGVLDKSPDPAHHGRFVYELTAAGRDLWPIVHALVVWGDHHRHGSRRWFGHATCGTELSPDGGCRKCRTRPAPEEVEIRPSPRRPSVRTDPIALRLRHPHRLLEPLDVDSPA